MLPYEVKAGSWAEKVGQELDSSHLVAAHGPWRRVKGKPRAGARLALTVWV